MTRERGEKAVFSDHPDYVMDRTPMVLELPAVVPSEAVVVIREGYMLPSGLHALVDARVLVTVLQGSTCISRMKPLLPSSIHNSIHAL